MLGWNFIFHVEAKGVCWDKLEKNSFSYLPAAGWACGKRVNTCAEPSSIAMNPTEQKSREWKMYVPIYLRSTRQERTERKEGRTGFELCVHAAKTFRYRIWAMGGCGLRTRKRSFDQVEAGVEAEGFVCRSVQTRLVFKLTADVFTGWLYFNPPL